MCNDTSVWNTQNTSILNSIYRSVEQAKFLQQFAHVVFPEVPPPSILAISPEHASSLDPES